MLRSHSDFKFENHHSILEASKIVIAEASQVHRVVLREVGRQEYVTHMENVYLDGDTWKHGDFYWGHYFNAASDSEEDRNEALKKALEDFKERTAKL